jgi:hypothetical protein
MRIYSQITMLAMFAFVQVGAWFLHHTANGQTPVTSTKPKPKRPQQRDAYREELSQLLEKNAVACTKDDDCDALGVGSMACGGPSEFVPVAKATLAKIQSTANELTSTIAEMDQARNKEASAVGICLALAKPKLICLSGKCEAAK